jgi:hypothetical protein
MECGSGNHEKNHNKNSCEMIMSNDLCSRFRKEVNEAGIMKTHIMSNMIKKFIGDGIILSILFAPIGVAAEMKRSPEVPNEAKFRQSKMLPYVQPTVKAWMNEQARKLSLGQLKEADLQPSIQSRFRNQGMKPGTAELTEFLILIQAVAYADQDIAAKQQELKTIEREKLQLEVRIQSMKTLLDDLKGKLDGMNEMSEMTSLRLQMTMDRRSKFIETLSNIMKKIGTTQETIIQNIK